MLDSAISAISGMCVCIQLRTKDQGTSTEKGKGYGKGSGAVYLDCKKCHKQPTFFLVFLLYCWSLTFQDVTTSKDWNSLIVTVLHSLHPCGPCIGGQCCYFCILFHLMTVTFGHCFSCHPSVCQERTCDLGLCESIVLQKIFFCAQVNRAIRTPAACPQDATGWNWTASMAATGSYESCLHVGCLMLGHQGNIWLYKGPFLVSIGGLSGTSLSLELMIFQDPSFAESSTFASTDGI